MNMNMNIQEPPLNCLLITHNNILQCFIERQRVILDRQNDEIKIRSFFQTPFGGGPPPQNIFAAGPSPFANSDFSLAELDPLKK